MARNYKELREKMKKKAASTKPKHAFEMRDGEELDIPGLGPGLGPFRHGFTKVGDQIRPSPDRLAENDAITAEQAGVDALVATVMRFAAEANSKIAARRHQWWKEITYDLGLENYPGPQQRLRLRGEWISMEPEPEPEPEAHR